jgi:hypothetical protein
MPVSSAKQLVELPRLNLGFRLKFVPPIILGYLKMENQLSIFHQLPGGGRFIIKLICNLAEVGHLSPSFPICLRYFEILEEKEYINQQPLLCNCLPC